MHLKGHLYVIAAPSGTGKTTLVHALVEQTPDLMVSISHTTRPKRPNEIDGLNYHFIDEQKFQDMVAKDEFLEHAMVFGHLYGTSKPSVMATLAKGKDVILEIDWQGHQQIKRLFPDSKSIFILPPSLADLRERLIRRNQDNPDVIAQRLADTKIAVSHLFEFDYIVINDDFEHALADLKIIIAAGRLKVNSQAVKYATVINALKTMP